MQIQSYEEMLETYKEFSEVSVPTPLSDLVKRRGGGTQLWRPLRQVREWLSKAVPRLAKVFGR